MRLIKPGLGAIFDNRRFLSKVTIN
jgi:hypothetical protein